MKLNGRHVIVTGAAAGIGRAICLRFAQEGARVSIVDIDLARAGALRDEIVQNGGSAAAIRCNVCNQDECEAAVAAARNAFGCVDILVNCAGGAIVGGAFQKFGECTREFMQRLIGVNLMGTLYFSRAVVPEMKERRSGKVLNFSSIRGIVGDGNCVLYGTAKGAINSRPGPGGAKNYLNCAGTCEEVAALALFLVSDDARFITGETVVIDGGRSRAALGDRSAVL